MEMKTIQDIFTQLRKGKFFKPYGDKLEFAQSMRIIAEIVLDGVCVGRIIISMPAEGQLTFLLMDSVFYLEETYKVTTIEDVHALLTAIISSPYLLAASKLNQGGNTCAGC